MIPFHTLAQAQPIATTTATTGTPATTHPAATEQPPLWANPWFPVVLAVGVFYLIMIRPQKSKEKERKQWLSALKRGDRVTTIGGIIGTVVEAKDDEIVVKVDETNNTKITFTRSAIHKVMNDAEK